MTNEQSAISNEQSAISNQQSRTSGISLRSMSNVQFPHPSSKIAVSPNSRSFRIAAPEISW
jgi:hypothetical protein